MRFDELIGGLPTPWRENLLPVIRERIVVSKRKLIVLDDDPTGCQTVHSLPLYAEWSKEALSSALKEESDVVYILTNSRALSAGEAADLARTIGERLSRLSWITGRKISVVSRSDSTLRGHFPAETDALAEVLSIKLDAIFIIPFFPEGGRYTVSDVHWVRQGNMMIPAAQTEYARDPVFHYSYSYLPKWVEEKTRGRVRAEEIERISIEEIRTGGPERLTRRLMELKGGKVLVVNAADYKDLDVFALASLNAEMEGKRFLYRTAASFVRSRGGISPRELLSAEELAPEVETAPGALVVVGSYVQRTTRQMYNLLEMEGTAGIELSVRALLDERREKEIRRATEMAERAIREGLVAVVFTERKRVSARSPEEALMIGRRISSALVEIVRGLSVRPSFILSKGGVTSHDIAVKGLGVKRTFVLGQVYPGVPVWRVDGISYIVFPGNVGDDTALVEVMGRLRGGDDPIR